MSLGSDIINALKVAFATFDTNGNYFWQLRKALQVYDPIGSSDSVKVRIYVID